LPNIIARNTKIDINALTIIAFKKKGIELIPIRVRHLHHEIYGFRVGILPKTDATIFPRKAGKLS
jgi:hypothetical protein